MVNIFSAVFFGRPEQKRTKIRSRVRKNTLKLALINAVSKISEVGLEALFKTSFILSLINF